MDIHEIINTLRVSWSAETAFEASAWTPDNPARGQCAVSSLLVQDLLGGEIVRFAAEYKGEQEKHFANSVDGALIDVTRSQYGTEAVFATSTPNLEGFSSLREKLLADEDTARRYGLLKKQFALVD